MKLAYLTGEYPRATDTFIQREVAGLRACQFEVLTTSVRRTGPEHLTGQEQRDEQAQTFHLLEHAQNPLHLLSAHAKLFGKNPMRWLRALRTASRTSQPGLKGWLYNMIYFAEAGVLARHLQDNSVTHLHNHIAKSSCTVAMLTSALTDIPFSFTLHGPDIFFEPTVWRLDEKIKRATFVSCISHFCRSQAMAFSSEEDWQKLHIVHCGVEPERYAKTPAGQGRRLLFVGRLAAVKGLPVLFDAMAQLGRRDIHLDIVGDGLDREALEARAKAQGIAPQLTFHGYRSQTEVSEHIAACDALVLPSFAEGLPVVLMEAMASARPVVTTRIAGVPELVEDGVNGFLCAPGDSGSLSQALLRALESGGEMGAKGREKVIREFDARTEAARLANLFEAYAEGTAAPIRPNPKVQS